MTREQIKKFGKMHKQIYDLIFRFEDEKKEAKRLNFCAWGKTWHKKAVNTAIRVKDLVAAYDAEWEKDWNGDDDCYYYYHDFEGDIDYENVCNYV